MRFKTDCNGQPPRRPRTDPQRGPRFATTDPGRPNGLGYKDRLTMPQC